jgi:hypothetical protein
MICKKRKYSNGGKVVSSESEYGKPTFGRAVLAKAGIGDGYGNSKSAPKPKDKDAGKRMSISNAPSKLSETLAKRKQMLDQ